MYYSRHRRYRGSQGRWGSCLCVIGIVWRRERSYMSNSYWLSREVLSKFTLSKRKGCRKREGPRRPVGRGSKDGWAVSVTEAERKPWEGEPCVPEPLYLGRWRFTHANCWWVLKGRSFKSFIRCLNKTICESMIFYSLCSFTRLVEQHWS